MQHNFSCFQTVLHIDHFLIRATLPVQLRILLFHFKSAVHNYIQIRYDRLILNLIPLIPGVQPLCLFRELFTDLFCKCGNRLSVPHIQRISSAVCDSADITFFQLFKQLFFCAFIKRVEEFKNEDGHLYAIYGTPAENLCGVQVQQFRKKYGIIENVSDREYVSNSFHCHVTEEITPIEKQDLEGRFWNLSNGGKIQYVKYPISYNVDAIKSLVRRAMAKGYYEGVNLSLSYCDDCGHEELDMDVCPECGSTNLTKIERMNGYLSYSRVKGDTRLNDAKMAEIAERKSM